MGGRRWGVPGTPVPGTTVRLVQVVVVYENMKMRFVRPKSDAVWLSGCMPGLLKSGMCHPLPLLG